MDITFECSLIRFVNFVDGNQLNIGCNAMLSAVVKHFLGLLDPAHERSDKAFTAPDQVMRANFRWFGRYSQQYHNAVGTK